jgi:hypothetical protein
VNLSGGNKDTITKTTYALIHPSKEVGLEVNTGEIKYMLISLHHNAEQNYDMMKTNRFFENVGTTVRNQNLIREEIK